MTSDTASHVQNEVRQWAFAYAEFGAKFVLKDYGDKARGRLNRPARNRYDAHRHVERYNRHTVLPAPPEPDLTSILNSAYELLPSDAVCMRDAIDCYVRNRIATMQPHDVHVLISVIVDWGCNHAPT